MLKRVIIQIVVCVLAGVREGIKLVEDRRGPATFSIADALLGFD